MQLRVAILAVLIAYVSGAAVQTQESVDFVKVLESYADGRPAFVEGRSLFDGVQNSGDKLLHRAYYTKLAASGIVQTQDVRYVGVSNTKISYIAAFAVGNTQSATAEVTAGGVNTNNVTIRLASARSAGFVFWVEIWGR